ncbi:MAG: mOMP-like family protein [Parachlamydiales bacterium]|nr:mOMP-like family protein [Parachlamydiales bacterium]
MGSKKIAPPRLLWMGLICCLPWIVSAQENATETTFVNSTEEKVEVDESHPSNPAEPADVSALPAIVSDPEISPGETIASESHSTVGMVPQSCGKVMLEFLFWEGIEDDLRYGIKNWTSLYPSSPVINQKLAYDPGVRASVFVPICYDEWEIGATYTHFYTSPPVTRVDDPAGNLFGSLNFTDYGTSFLQPANYIKGKWTLKMNILDLELRRSFVIGQSLMLQPSMGGKACFVRQRVDVHYNYVTPSATTGNRVRGLSSVWAVGPEAGLDMRILLPKQISLSIKGSMAAMLGIFDGNTTYSEYYAVDYESALTEKKTRLFEVGQLSCGLSTWWSAKGDSFLELTLGWEAQVWWRQMRINWWSTMTMNNQGADLVLQGPFLRGSLNF